MTFNTVKRHDPSKGLAAKTLTTKADRIVVADAAAGNLGKYARGENVQTRDISGGPANERTGFPLVNRTTTDSTLAFDDLTRTFSITPTGASFSIWSDDFEFVFDVAQTVVITDTEGIWYFYFDSAGVLQATQTYSTRLYLGPDVWVSYGYWDAVNKEMVLDIFDERHGMQMDGATHLHWHEYIGAAYGSGFSLNSLLVDQGPPVNLDTYAQFGVDSGVFQDEDKQLTASAVLSTTGLPILYLDGAGGVNLRETSQAGYSVQTDVGAGVGATGRLVYNDITTGTRVVVPDNDFVLCHVFATGANTDAKRIYAVMGQDTYSNKNDAEDGANTEIANLKQLLPVQEFLPIATVIFQTSDTYTNAVKARVVSTDSGDDYVDWRFSGVAQGTGASPTDHNLLSNRSVANSHPAAAINYDPTNLDNFLASVAVAAGTPVQDLLDQLDNLGLTGAARTWRFTGTLTPAQLTASVDDYAPAGYDEVTTLRLSADAAWNITGLVPPTDDNYLYILQNVGSETITLTNEDASSVAANRFALTADFELAADAQAIVVYDSTANRWRLVGGGGGSGTTSISTLAAPVQYRTDAGQVLTNMTPTVVNFEDLAYDDDNLVTVGAAWVWTAPKDMYVSVACSILFASAAWTAGEIAYMTLNNSGGANLFLDRWECQANSTQELPLHGTAEVFVSEGDTLSITVYHDFGSNQNLKADATSNYIVISEIPSPLSLNTGQPDLYSETETKLPGQWWQDPNNLTDYYPYYVKKVDLGALPNAASKDVAHGLSNYHLDSVKIWGNADNGTSNFPLPHIGNTVALNLAVALFMLDSTNLQVITGIDRTTYTGYAYVKYAKTTDTPVTRDEAYGNGGAGFDDYSTSETVTNKRWLGSTVYRKVVDCGALPNTGVTNTNHGIIGIDEVINMVVVAKNSASSLWAQFDYDIDGTARLACILTNTQVQITATSDLSAYTQSYAVIEYTKT